MLGTWKGIEYGGGSKIHFINTTVIDFVDGNQFSGYRSKDADDRNHTGITTALSGYIINYQVYIENGKIISVKQPPHSQWIDCGNCTLENKIIITHDTIILSSLITGCNKNCEGISDYYKLLCDYDTLTQRYLVNHFGKYADIQTFNPCIKNTPPIFTAKSEEKKQDVTDSLNTAIIASKRQQQIQDSIKIALNVAKEKLQVEDSLKNVAILVMKRQQHIQDSIKIALNVAKKKLQVEDSLKNVAILIMKRQQHIQDSIKIAVIIAKKKLQVEDSLKNVAILIKKRQQLVTDSIKNAVNLAIIKPVVIDSVGSVTKFPDDKTKTLTQRNNVLIQTYNITTPDILIELFDNAEIDGDRVSVYHNNFLIVSNKPLLREPIILTIHADSANRTHEFILVAENLGTIPPNTALMRITAGKQVYELTVKTDLKTNAKIVFYYDGN